MLLLVSIAVVLSTEALLSLHFYCLARGFFDFLCHKSVFGAKHTEAKKENVDATMCRIKTEDAVAKRRRLTRTFGLSLFPPCSCTKLA